MNPLWSRNARSQKDEKGSLVLVRRAQSRIDQPTLEGEERGAEEGESEVAGVVSVLAGPPR